LPGIAWYTKAAEKGNPGAQYGLGAAYATGIGVEQDLKKAIEFFRKAAEAGHAQAQNDLGMLLLNGDPAGSDFKDGQPWIRRAAAQGYAVAEYNLGVFYHEGVGVPKDIVEALKWIYLSADQGYKKAVWRRTEILIFADPSQKAEARRRADAFVPETELHLDCPWPFEKSEAATHGPLSPSQQGGTNGTPPFSPPTNSTPPAAGRTATPPL
jgi:hypothetical protein